jgi:hypothetical protein
MTDTVQSNPVKPVFKKQLPNGVAAAVFENSRDGRIYRSVNLQRSYRKQDQWHRMSLYLDHQDIPFAIEALQAAWKYLSETPVVRAADEQTAA